MSKEHAIYWLRSDLRIIDNQAMLECLKHNQTVTVVFPRTNSQKKAGAFRKNFISQSFLELKSKLEKRGVTVLPSELGITELLPTILKENPFTSLYFTQEYAWDEREEEKLVREFCHTHDIELHSYDQGTLIPLKDLPFTLDEMPFIFTDFRKKVELGFKSRDPESFSMSENQIEAHPTSVNCFHGGESYGLARLNYYLWESDAIQTYKETRNGLLHFDDSTKLSPWLNTGCISARTVYHELKRYEQEVKPNESTYWLFFELLWRDYFKFFSLKFGKKIFLKNGIYPGVTPNGSNLIAFEAWCAGETPDEFVNANMKELNQTGWMSNRGRQNVASYLIHDLGVNWTWGAEYFEKQLLDYDPDLNWGNWLYLSGRGSDPRARKFNTIKQAETYDPDGEYRQQWR